MDEEYLKNIIRKLDTFNPTKSIKLYGQIYELFTNENKLKNYSHNKSGIRFKLNNFSKEILIKLNDIIDVFQEELDKNNDESNTFMYSIKENKKKKKIVCTKS